MAPSLPANPNFYILALFCPLFGSLGCEDCWRCKRGCQRKGHSNIVMLVDTWEPELPNWLSVTIICVVWNKPWGKSYIVHKKCNKQSLHHPQSLEDALGFQEELLTELTKRAQMSEKTADRALAEQFARSKPNFCTLLLSSASPRSLLGLKMPASIKIGYLPSYTASNLVSMEGFCILWAGKLVIGSAVSSCAKCRQETKMWTLVIGTSLSGQDQLILAARRNGIVTIRDDIWERGGIKQNCYQSLSLHPQFSFTQIAINSSGNSGNTSESCTESHFEHWC